MAVKSFRFIQTDIKGTGIPELVGTAAQVKAHFTALNAAIDAHVASIGAQANKLNVYTVIENDNPARAGYLNMLIDETPLP